MEQIKLHEGNNVRQGVYVEIRPMVALIILLIGFILFGSEVLGDMQ